jgi:hypothetical protein
MNNREIFLKDPSDHKLVNEGVANVNDDRSTQAMEVLRYELETFVCDGQYEKGIEQILEAYLNNINEAQQPGVWISGFYGSGKSHLVKMLRALWIDDTFKDGASARGITTLSQNIKDLFKELSSQAKRHGGLHSASGTLGAGASGSVRLALLRIIFKSAGLPEHYHVARFIMWLKAEGIYDTVKQHVEDKGADWDEELDNFHVAEELYDALCSVKPKVFSSSMTASEILTQLYPNKEDVTNDEMIKAIKQALTKEGKFPLTLVVFDEVQQYIGEDSDRSMVVQEAVEACCKNIGGKLVFIATGQTAVTGTANLKRLEGRFTIRVELSDTDVDAVIRKVILGKKPDAIKTIDQIMNDNIGEISRHLAGTDLGHYQDDTKHFASDYPILPVRRRFWEHTLRILDQTGTDSQLRNQLSMIHKVIRTNLDKPLGNVVPADYLYFDSADKLLQSRILPRKIHEKTMSWLEGTEDENLTARACGLVFLINKLGGSNKELGIKANIDTIADLMVDDITHGSSALRNRLPAIMNNCDLLMRIGDEYRIQTEESSAWNDEFLSQKHQLANEAHRIETEREDRIRKMFHGKVKKVSLTQGNSKVNREFYPVFNSQLPGDSIDKIYIWVRNGWSINENTVLADARQAGTQSPTIFTYIPKRAADDLRHNLIAYKAANGTLEKRGVPKTPEGIEAKAAMETTKQTSDGKINELLNDLFAGSRVFQGGGKEISGNNLQEMIVEAAQNSLQRLYPQFSIADHTGWGKVYANSKKGAPDALKAVGDKGEPSKNQVCKQILAFIAGGKKGLEIRTHFETSHYGWSGDAVDGGLQVLLIAGLIRIDKINDSSKNLPGPTELERKLIGKTIFKVESATVTTAQRIQVRKLLQKLDCKAKQGEEIVIIPTFLSKLKGLADEAGGDAPMPETPDLSVLTDITHATGNDQILAIYNNRNELSQFIKEWKDISIRIEKRFPLWLDLTNLLNHAKGLKDAEIYKKQAESITNQRHLLSDPDPITPLISNVTQILRDSLNDMDVLYVKKHEEGMDRLRNDSNWAQLEPEQKNNLLEKKQLTLLFKLQINVQTTTDIIKTLTRMSLTMMKDRIEALSGRFDQVLQAAAEEMEPEVQFVQISRPTLKTEAEIEEWITIIGKKLKEALVNGPVMMK